MGLRIKDLKLEKCEESNSSFITGVHSLSTLNSNRVLIHSPDVVQRSSWNEGGDWNGPLNHDKRLIKAYLQFDKPLSQDLVLRVSNGHHLKLDTLLVVFFSFRSYISSRIQKLNM